MKREKKIIRGKQYDELESKLNYFCKTIPHDEYEIYKILSNGKSFRFKELLVRPYKLFKIIKSLKNGFPISIRLKIVNASIEIKNSVRLFYPDQLLNTKNGKPAYSAKVGLESAFRSGNLANEISAKAFIEKNAPRFPIPKTISYDKTNFLWFVEKYIAETCKVSNDKKASIFLSDHAIDLYRPFFFPMTLERFLSNHHITLDLIHGIFQEAGESIEEFHHLSTLAGAYTHGDLAPINMIVDEQGRLYVIDWEHFGIGSVASDLVKLLRINPRWALSVLSNINKCGQGCSIPAVEQFKIALGVEIIQNRRNFKNILNFHVEHAGKNQSKARFLLSKAENDALFLMSKLKEFIL